MGMSVGSNSIKAAQPTVHEQTTRTNNNAKKSTDNSIASTVKDAVTKPDSTAGRILNAAGRVGSLISTVA